MDLIEVDLENDLLSSPTIIEKAKHSKIYAQNLYAALCNNLFYYDNQEWSCSWRGAGDIVAKIRNYGEDYNDWYCSGIASSYKDGYVTEGDVTEEIRTDFIRLGWIIKPYDRS